MKQFVVQYYKMIISEMDFYDTFRKELSDLVETLDGVSEVIIFGWKDGLLPQFKIHLYFICKVYADTLKYQSMQEVKEERKNEIVEKLNEYKLLSNLQPVKESEMEILTLEFENKKEINFYIKMRVSKTDQSIIENNIPFRKRKLNIPKQRFKNCQKPKMNKEEE